MCGGDAEAFSFSRILSEIESSRFAVARAFKTVMLGAQAVLRPELVEPGAGPEGVNRLLDAVRDLEIDVRAASTGGAGFFLNALPRCDATDPRRPLARDPSIADHRVKYLPSNEAPGEPCLGVALDDDDLRALEPDAFGRVSLPVGKVVGVTPFLLMPSRGMAEAARRDEARYADHAGLGYNVPTFVRLYADFVAFALQEHPAILASILLARAHPGEAAKLRAFHAQLTDEVSAAVLYFLGYEDTEAPPAVAVGRRARDAEVLCRCGLRLFDALVGWHAHCCRTMLIGEFVESFRELCIEKVGDLKEHALNRRTIPPRALLED